MLVKFNALTGASNNDHDGRKAIDYLNGIEVWKPVDGETRPQKVTRARPPIAISGNADLFMETCALLTFKNRYASGTLAFEAGDIDIHAFEAGDEDIRRVCNALMRDFEDTAFVGIPEDCRPHIVWNAHTDKGRLELNFVFARTIDNGDGKLRSFNPKPPGALGNAIWGAFQNVWNHRYGWADPNDPTRARKVKKPKSVHKGPKLDQNGKAIKDIREEITDALYAQIDEGQITNREDVIIALERMGYTLNRKSKGFVSVKATPDSKPIRLEGDIYAAAFTSLEWLAKQRKTHATADFDTEDETLQQELDALRRTHGNFLKKRLKISEQPITVNPDLIHSNQTQDPEAEGYCEAEPKTFTNADRPKGFQRSFKGKLWQELYTAPTLPSELEAKLRYVDPKTKSVWLDDKSSIKDMGRKMRGYRTTDATLNLMVLQAKAKGWSGIKISGSEQVLRNATRAAFAQRMTIEGKTDEMQAIILEELTKLRATQQQPDPQPDESDLKPKTYKKPKVEVPFDPMKAGNGEAYPLDQGPIPTKRQREFWEDYTTGNAKFLRLWDKLYGYATLPADLRPSILYVMDKPATVGLKGGGVIRDHGNRITVKGSSEDALRIIIAQAKAKGWTGLSIRGSEEYLRMAERVGAEEGFPIKTRSEQIMERFYAGEHQLPENISAEYNLPPTQGSKGPD